ncbi:MAG: hypothetical protein GY808_03490, partial [Gammaproteobacteria bacterium]|nr:hypothetical protein [Gammaproteobacteria bacterium]
MMTLYSGFSFAPWLIVAVTSVSFLLPDLRRQYFSLPVYNMVKKILPEMSETEKDALEAGDVW